MLGLLYASHSLQYRVLLNKIDHIEKGYVKKISKAELIGASLFELLKDLPEREQQIFLIKSLKWLAVSHPKTHKDFIKKSLTGVSRVLDAHSTYLSPAHFNRMMSIGKSQMAGIGVELCEKNGMIEIVGLLPESPAQQAQLEKGDLITHINGVEVTPTKEYIIEKLRGEAGSFVRLTIQRQHHIFSVEMSRKVMQLNLLNVAVKQNVLYLQLNYFTHQAHQSIKYALLNHPNVKGCILDLRNNPGGIFQQGVFVAGLFLKKGVKILDVHTRMGVRTFGALEKDYLKKKPLVLLVNNATASSAEIVAGCLKDTKRGLLIGEKTLGKGTVQETRGIFPACVFGGFKHTVAEFFTSSGQPIHNVGIDPDIYENSTETEDLVLKKGIDIILNWHLLRESNPCPHRERVIS